MNRIATGIFYHPSFSRRSYLAVGARLDVAVLTRKRYPGPGKEKTRAMRAFASCWIRRRWSAPRKLSAYSL